MTRRRHRPKSLCRRHMMASTLTLGTLALACAVPASAGAQEDDTIETPAASAATRPAIKSNRWQEDWSALANPALRTEPLDGLKYIPLDDTNALTYLSLGLTLRERFEDNEAPAFGIGGRKGDSYVIQRLQTHMDLRIDGHWQLFGQFEDARAFDKTTLTPADQNQADLRQAFVAYSGDLTDDITLKVRAGRQEMGFDRQRFVSTRDGPNVRQAFDAVWVNMETAPWRIISFWSHPVQYRTGEPFDDYSNTHLQYGGIRVEHAGVGPGELSAYYSRYQNDTARYLDASGLERRDIFDLRYAGVAAGFDWDVEGMAQWGTVGPKSVGSWAVGALTGYTLTDVVWTPRLGLQADAASGDDRAGDGRLGTFNPLFPNGYYFALAGYTGYANLIHLKPSLTVKPMPKLSLMTAAGLLWRQTTADAVYVQPSNAVPGTAGKGTPWTGVYGQLRADYAVTANLTTAVEAVHYAIGDTLRRAGGHDSDYLGIEVKLGW
ncbi:alginate export family protein [Nitrospirillum sp. BR 11164]|uniref:alginate export family protein n=1 Tax=Nitrospirillum sp. BR 11164 TaxID=3104324 RepID=UPI002AFFF7D7|nr:alginate export family protein [Nitrospirillum sp. BR 11164]MEA1648858.1 alginate export family protein [Nitrospirillum sp. BR 11164]